MRYPSLNVIALQIKRKDINFLLPRHVKTLINYSNVHYHKVYPFQGNAVQQPGCIRGNRSE